MRWRRVVGGTCALVLALCGAGIAAFHASPAQDWKTVDYGGMSFQVPVSWPVYDLSVDRHRCVRFDQHAVYLGTQGPEPACPARAIGRTEALQVTPLAGSPSLPDTTRSIVTSLPRLGVMATLSYLRNRSQVRQILGSVAVRSGVTNSMPAAEGPERSADLLSLDGSGGSVTRTGQAFDTCGAPSLDAMNAWLSASPYTTMNIYIGGDNRACADGNLSRAWVSKVLQSGWALVPTYVGLQAPCVQQSDLATIDPSQAADQGAAAADDAATRAANFGLAAGTPIYFDMEGYGNDQGCIRTVQKFVSAWGSELHSKGYVAGLYGSSASTIANEAAVYDDPFLTRPDDVWVANWNGAPALYGDPYFPDANWPPHHRLHQYEAGHDETWGGYTINLDIDYSDGAVAASGSS
jgi:hypothetical protein